MVVSNLVNWGYEQHSAARYQAKIRITNIIGLLLAILGLVYAGISLPMNPWLSLYPLTAGVIGLLVPVLNKYGKHITSRIVISILPITLDAIYHAFLASSDLLFIPPLYFSQVAFALIPWMVFDHKEFKILLGCCLYTLLVLTLQFELNQVLEMPLAINLFDFPVVHWITYFAASAILFTCLLTLLNATRTKEKALVAMNKKLSDSVQELSAAESRLVLTEKMASLGTLIAGIAHEVKNPLHFIAGGKDGMKSILEENEEPSVDEIKEYLEVIEVGVDRLTALINGLNLMNRNSESFSEACDLHQIIDNALLILSGKIKSGVKVKRDFHDEKLVIAGNVGKLHQVMLNVIDNALHAVEGAGIIRLSTRLEHDGVVILVQDNGYGLDPDQLKAATEPFYSTKPPGVGTGLGLTITNEIITAHHGQIQMDSKKGKGTSVELQFPISRLIRERVTA